MSASHARIGAVIRLELLTQRREPLTVLYMLVLGLLAAAFTAAGPVELVRNRGTVTRDAPWSMLLAATALTAFGQIITTMVSATVVLRDRADRVSDLLVATHLTRREYLTGKLLAALVMLGVIYTAVPFGLTAGALMAGGQLLPSIRAAMPPFVLVVLPTMLAVGALQFAIGVVSGRLWVIVGQGLALIWLWSACTDAALSDAHGAMAAVLDPFGSAAVIRATAKWTDVERTTRELPITLSLLASRALWLTLGSVAVAWAMSRAAAAVPRRTPVAKHDATEPIHHEAAGAAWQRASAPTATWSVVATAHYVARWMLRDMGWRVLTLLGVLNVGIHAVLDSVGGTATSVALAALYLHARLFLILLATIYAGELVWRERDERSAALFDALPIPDLAMVMGRVLGVIAAQVVLVGALVAAAVLGALVRTRTLVDLLVVCDAAVRSVLAPFVVWMLLALAVHALVQQKVAAHLLCIAAWVVALLLSRVAAQPPDGDHLGWQWALWGLLAVAVAWLVWVRGETASPLARIRNLRRRAELL